MRTAAVLTISDSVKQGTRQDTAGPALAQLLEENGYTVIMRDSVADERQAISAALLQLCEAAQFIVTTGGTGIAARDVTPEATEDVCERLLPGIAEHMRTAGAKQTPLAPLSRAVCGTKGRSLIINTPGNPDGALYSLRSVLDLIPHALDLLAGKTNH
jgi:molybdenum cofactor synthesis domain-containing protein